MRVISSPESCSLAYLVRNLDGLARSHDDELQRCAFQEQSCKCQVLRGMAHNSVLTV